MNPRDTDFLDVTDWHAVHDWTLNWHWNGGPSEYPIRQCVLCNATECALDFASDLIAAYRDRRDERP